MTREEVKVGQLWKRKDGRLVKTIEERELRGSSRELLLEPADDSGARQKGRKSWKWDGGILNDLEYVGPA